MSALFDSEKIARYFQREACDITYEMMIADSECKPIMALPTGSGKSHTFALFIDRIMSDDPSNNVLVLCDRGAILEQDHEELEEYFGIEIGLYSADLGSSTIQKITVAGIQSIYRKANLFEKFTWVIIDECDSVNENDKSMYRKFLSHLNARCLGATATPYGLKEGYLHEGKNAFFNCISVDYTRGEKYLKLVDENYIADIMPFPTSVKFDPSGLKEIAGDYSIKAQSEKFDIEAITRAAMIETVYYGKNFKRWLIFAIDIQHAENIGRILNEMNISNCVIHSKMDGDKYDALADSKKGMYRAIINVDILTIGYNDPKVDLAVLMYCTKSPRKHVQAPGRLRPDPDVPVKVVLDFGGNFSRLGPLNDVKVKSINEKKKKTEAPMMKSCPECNLLNHLGAKFCKNCEFEFVSEVKMKSSADSTAVMIKRDFEEKEKGARDWCAVTSVKYSRHEKIGKPDSVRVEYKCGYRIFSDWIFIESNGYAFYKAKNWMQFRLKEKTALPKNVTEFLENTDLFKTPVKIKVDTTGKHATVLDCEF